ncbi:hypothetical protein E6W36_10400 [Hankyongella ginsenosidimutans]|uniref:Uncharacterized protein n=1 Tax=Hankyongella ginsenosidimutans TaxID=1763828 RepID=A0A4D7CC69_9SPHN|nr:hypothetical protein [Hankyongella ginsenosidimutans]QCI79802.1 hypothetical protein E6W36_10400 [Hankyongella ginsenosidimutans]
MTLDYAEEMPDAIMEFVGWYPRTYQEHFQASGFRDSDLLIAAFELTPPIIRSRFNALVRELNIIVLSGLTSLQSVLRADPQAPVGPAAAVLAREMREHVMQLAALINGPRSAEQQSTVDEIFDAGDRRLRRYPPAGRSRKTSTPCSLTPVAPLRTISTPCSTDINISLSVPG